MNNNRIKKVIIILIIVLIEYYNFRTYKYCNKCLKKKNISYKKCLKCPIKIIFKGLKVFSEKQTLNEIIFNNKSIARFGDGEFDLIFGYSIRFQKYNEKLSNRLIEVLNSNEKNLLIGINILSNIKDVEKYTNSSKLFYLNWIEKNKIKLGNFK